MQLFKSLRRLKESMNRSRGVKRGSVSEPREVRERRV
jgi:hypothetical protein